MIRQMSSFGLYAINLAGKEREKESVCVCVFYSWQLLPGNHFGSIMTCPLAKWMEYFSKAGSGGLDIANDFKPYPSRW